MKRKKTVLCFTKENSNYWLMRKLIFRGLPSRSNHIQIIYDPIKSVVKYLAWVSQGDRSHSFLLLFSNNVSWTAPAHKFTLYPVDHPPYHILIKYVALGVVSVSSSYDTKWNQRKATFRFLICFISRKWWQLGFSETLGGRTPQESMSNVGFASIRPVD